METGPTERPNVPRLSATVQWQIAAGLLLAVLALFWFLPWLSAALSPPPAPPPPAAADGSFAATDRQWQTLKFATVQSANLDEAASSEGKIAVDDDLTTPVFSPFTGRVTRIAAKAGDRVRAGQVLFAVAASEAVATAVRGTGLDVAAIASGTACSALASMAP